jgi:hypothetical protein
MPCEKTEYLLSGGESPKDVGAYMQYRLDAQRGKTMLQLKAVAEEVNPEVHTHWSPRSFTPIETDVGVFNAIVCNIAYHFHKHGQTFRTVQRMTDEALRAFREHRHEAVIRADGLLQIKDIGLTSPMGGS